MPPVALSDDQRGPRAAWLRRHRIPRFGTGDGGLVKLSKALLELGLDRSWSTIKGWESSDERSPIPPDALPYLEQLFGESAPRPYVAPSTPELIAAIDALVQTIRDERAERLEWERGVVDSIREVALALARRDGPEPAPRAVAQQ